MHTRITRCARYILFFVLKILFLQHDNLRLYQIALPNKVWLQGGEKNVQMSCRKSWKLFWRKLFLRANFFPHMGWGRFHDSIWTFLLSWVTTEGSGKWDTCRPNPTTKCLAEIRLGVEPFGFLPTSCLSKPLSACTTSMEIQWNLNFPREVDLCALCTKSRRICGSAWLCFFCPTTMAHGLVTEASLCGRMTPGGSFLLVFVSSLHAESRDLVHFNEYFSGDDGRGCGAAAQGWTCLGRINHFLFFFLWFVQQHSRATVLLALNRVGDGRIK